MNKAHWKADGKNWTYKWIWIESELPWERKIITKKSSSMQWKIKLLEMHNKWMKPRKSSQILTKKARLFWLERCFNWNPRLIRNIMHLDYSFISTTYTLVLWNQNIHRILHIWSYELRLDQTQMSNLFTQVWLNYKTNRIKQSTATTTARHSIQWCDKMKYHIVTMDRLLAFLNHLSQLLTNWTDPNWIELNESSELGSVNLVLQKVNSIGILNVLERLYEICL